MLPCHRQPRSPPVNIPVGMAMKSSAHAREPRMNLDCFVRDAEHSRLPSDSRLAGSRDRRAASRVRHKLCGQPTAPERAPRGESQAVRPRGSTRSDSRAVSHGLVLRDSFPEQVRRDHRTSVWSMARPQRLRSTDAARTRSRATKSPVSRPGDRGRAGSPGEAVRRPRP